MVLPIAAVRSDEIMPALHTAQLPEFVEAVNLCGGDPHHPDIVRRYYPIELHFDTRVDQDLSPFSEEYCQQQIALYREITGRDLDQEKGELHAGEIEHLVSAANPIGWSGSGVAETLRSLSTMLSLADLEGSARILDMGAGYGVSSEIFAFAGYRVHAVDIDPVLGELSCRRTRARGLDIVRSTLNFDDLSAIEAGQYAGAFFYQSLHHCLRPWQLIADLKTKLGEHGVIGFSGEPVQANWWQNWGLRLDGESLFAMRCFGWFEAGWSHEFIRECFARSEMSLMVFGGGSAGSEIGMATADEAKREAVLARAERIGLRQICAAGELVLDEGRFASAIGEPAGIFGSRGFAQSVSGEGALLFGPYVTLPAGDYEVALLAKRARAPQQDPAASLVVDVVSGLGNVTHARLELTGCEPGRTQDATIRLQLSAETANVEIRALVSGTDLWTVSFPRILRIRG